MRNNIIEHLKRYCEFDELSHNIDDETKMKNYLLQKFTLIFEPLFVNDQKFHTLIGKDNLNYGAAHLWSYKFNKRIGQYVFPKGITQNLIFKSIKTFFFDHQERAKFFDMTNILSIKKQPIIDKRGSFDEMQNDKDFENPVIILPEDVLFPKELKPKDYNSQQELIFALNSAYQNIMENADKPRLDAFFKYLSEKYRILLGVDIKNYQSKTEILKLFPPILLEEGWQYLYRFIANLVPDRPSGGYFIRVKNQLKNEQVSNLQFICNYIYGKLALSELGLLIEDLKFKPLFTSLFTLFNNAFEKLLNK